MRNQLTREQRRKGGSHWTEAKAATVGAAFEAFNDQQRAAALARYNKIKDYRERGLTWEEIGRHQGRSAGSVKGLYHKVRARVGDPLTPREPATHCKREHLLSGENLYLYRGIRGCKTCRRDRQRVSRRRRKRGPHKPPALGRDLPVCLLRPGVGFTRVLVPVPGGSPR